MMVNIRRLLFCVGFGIVVGVSVHAMHNVSGKMVRAGVGMNVIRYTMLRRFSAPSQYDPTVGNRIAEHLEKLQSPADRFRERARLVQRYELLKKAEQHSANDEEMNAIERQLKIDDEEMIKERAWRVKGAWKELIGAYEQKERRRQVLAERQVIGGIILLMSSPLWSYGLLKTAR